MQQESYDLLLALFEAVLTFKIAYPAAEVQGAVLLQTSPPRDLLGTCMKAFLRVMREVRSLALFIHLITFLLAICIILSRDGTADHFIR